MITAEKLYKRFGSVEAVKDVTFSVEKGEIVGFLGSNAAGKTTTMRMLTCYFPPTSGTAKVAGFDIFEQSLDVRRNVGYLPENVPLYTDMTVEYFLGFMADLKGATKKDRKAKVEGTMERCGLMEYRDTAIGYLSKGYRQRVGIAQAIINDPPVLILDEPTVGLDPRQIIEIRNLIKSFGGKSTVILSTHILHEIEKVCDRILIIDNGKILAFDTLENLADRLTDDYTLNIMVEGPSEDVKNAIKTVPVVSKLHDLGKVKDNVYKYQMTVPKDFYARGSVAKAIAENGFSLIEMKTERMSAEDIFRTMVPDKQFLATMETAGKSGKSGSGKEK